MNYSYKYFILFSTSLTTVKKLKAKQGSTKKIRKTFAQEILFYVQSATRITTVAPASIKWLPQHTETLA